MAVVIADELAAFLEEGLGIHIATRNGRFEPSGARALALRVHEDREHVTVYLASVAAERLMDDLRANGQAAVGVARPVDERACQLKGFFVESRDARPDERALIDRQFDGFIDNLGQIGIPGAPLSGWARWPATAITLKTTALFEQTPGPNAGVPMP